VKIKITRLGKIDSATLDLRPITLIIGENNTNKSWTAYSAYALLSSLSSSTRESQITPRVINRALLEKINRLSTESSHRIEKIPTKSSFNFVFSRKEILESISKDLSLVINEADLAKVLSAPKELLKGASAKLVIPLDDIAQAAKFFFMSRGKDGSLLYGDAASPIGNEDYSWDSRRFGRLFVKHGVKTMTFTFAANEWKNWGEQIRPLLLNFTTRILGNVSALPAERKALVTLYKSISDEVLKQLPLPFQDFIQSLHLAESIATSQDVRTPNIRSKKLSELYSNLERVLGGTITFEKASIGARLVFSPAKNVSLPIQAASSIVRSLTGLLVALQQFSDGRNVLVVDEPEMNAHPNAQLAMVEILCALANLGNYVIATTHSPYVIDHINNLLAAGELAGKIRTQAAQKFVLKIKESFITPEMVSAYEISPQGTVSNLFDSERKRVSTTTFGNVSSSLENLYSDLLEMGQK
jgi:hypothetical protein